MSTGVLGTGSSALLAFQRALSTVGHNVANAATPGYSRQRIELQARAGDPSSMNIGQGVDVQSLRRLADGLVFARQVDSAGELGRLDQLSSLSARVDGLLSNTATSLSGPWSAFFNAAKGVVAEPTSTTARNQLLATGQQLAARWHSIDSHLSAMDQEVDRNIAGKVADANRLASEIASLNRDIVSAGAAGASPDMLDARDQRVQQLSTLVGAETLMQDDGAMNVFTAGGQPLVLGTRASKLSAIPDAYRPDRLQLAIDTTSGPVRLADSGIGGELGGLLEFRGRVLDPMRAELGRMATVFAETFNATQNAGVDYNGNPGADVFAIPAPRVDAHAANTGTATLTATVDDASALTGQNLVLRFDGSAWSAMRADTGEAVAMTGTGTAADPLKAGGIAITVGGSTAAGDRFQLTPTAGASAGIKVVMTDPAGIAAASPLVVKGDLGNLGDARAASAGVTDPAAFASFSGATIDFIDANNYTIDGAGPYAYTAGTPIAAGGWSLTLQGTPAAGDSFTLGRTPPRSSDNANARLLAGVDAARVLDNGSADLSSGLSRLTARAGNEARHAQLSLEAQQAIDTQVNAERESVSGVNLDEEAADMLRFQQAYQAAAQVIATADNMFQTLLGAVRR